MRQMPGRALEIAAGTATGTATAQAVTWLTLTDFRSYAGLRLEIDARPVVLTGANGAGKTNLLEALSLLSPGRGLRRARLAEMTRLNGGGPWGIAARLQGPGGLNEVGTALAPVEAGGGERRQVKIDGDTEAGPSRLAAVLGLSWLTPQMDRLFAEGASGRRRFLDRLVYGLDPEHARRVAAYEKAMRERSRLLKAGRADPAWLTALEETMAEWGVAVAWARRDAVARLAAALEADRGPFPRATLAVEGELADWLDQMPAVDAEDRFRTQLAENRGRDAEAGGALAGPHRADLQVGHAVKGMPAGLCSTGEQKALLIAIVLANARLQAARRQAVPILLLDEVAAHLDAGRRAALFEATLSLGAQAWFTGTDAGLFEPLGSAAQYYTVRDGRLFG